VGIANGLWSGQGLNGVDWGQVKKVGLALLFSPVIGFVVAGLLLLILKLFFRNPKLYTPPEGEDRPPWWIRTVLIGTCGGVSYAHGSNDGQKGMGLLLLVLIGFFPLHYALTVNEPHRAVGVYEAAVGIRADYAKAGVEVPKKIADNLTVIETELKDKATFDDLPRDKDTRWEVRQAISALGRDIKKIEADQSVPAELRKSLGKKRKEQFLPSVEYVPLWVVIGTALALGVGTTIGYKRIVVTVAEKIGKQHLTYGQGAAAETATAAIIEVASATGLSVSTTHTLNSAVAGTMIANRTGVQGATVKKILLAWLLTLPACMLLAGTLFSIGRLFVR
jgi:phosphate/sulfate permease